MKSAVLSLLMFGSANAGDWDYDHMEEWSHHFDMCGTNDQSPINIQSQEALYDSSVCSPHLNWTIDWSQHDFKVINNGHSIAVKAIEKLGSSSTLSADISDGSNQYRTLDEPIAKLQNHFRPDLSPIREFCLDSFHFHWGMEDATGSEHLVDDYQYPLEVHFVHYSCERDTVGDALAPYPGYANITAARDAGVDYHELAVVGVFFDVTDYDNPIFDAMLSDDVLDDIQFPGSDWKVINGIYLQQIIPTDIFDAGYYSYEGSLTTPPCTDIVRWHVSNSRSYIGKAQIARFRELMYTANASQAPNFRTPQYNVNPVYACMEAEGEAARDATATAIVWIWAVVVSLCMCCFLATCYYKSLADAKKQQEQAEAPAQKRQRLASKSSMDRRATFSVADGAHTGAHSPHH